MTAAGLVSLGTATLGEAWPAIGIVDAPLRPLSPEMTMAGPALTVRCRPGDNLALHLAIAQARGGEVLVVDYGGSTESGPFGEIMALACQMRGIVGMVIDGAVRDSGQIAALGFPVFARGVNIRGTVKADRGEIGVAVMLGTVRVAPGDIVLGDADAVVVIAPGDLAAARAVATVRVAKERAMMDRIRRGETTLSILGLTEGQTP